jgi:hypothetical protein
MCCNFGSKEAGDRNLAKRVNGFPLRGMGVQEIAVGLGVFQSQLMKTFVEAPAHLTAHLAKAAPAHSQSWQCPLQKGHTFTVLHIPVSEDGTMKIRFTLLALLSWIMLTGAFIVKCNSGTALVGKDGASHNRSPEAADSSLTATVNVTASGFMPASDPDGDALIFSLVVSPTLGVVNVVNTSTGAFTYLSNVPGLDSFSFKANDGKADSNVAIVQIAVVEQPLTWQPLGQALEAAATSPEVSSKSACRFDGEGEVLRDDGANDQPNSSLSGAPFCTAVDPFDTGHVIVAKEGCGLLRSFDGGLTWEVLKIGGLVPDSCENILIHFNAFVPGLLYVGINQSAGGALLLRSVDGAHSWQLLDVPKQGRIQALVSTTLRNGTDVRLIAQFLGDKSLYFATDRPFSR